MPIVAGMTGGVGCSAKAACRVSATRQHHGRGGAAHHAVRDRAEGLAVRDRARGPSAPRARAIRLRWRRTGWDRRGRGEQHASVHLPPLMPHAPTSRRATTAITIGTWTPSMPPASSGVSTGGTARCSWISVPVCTARLVAGTYTVRVEHHLFYLRPHSQTVT